MYRIIEIVVRILKKIIPAPLARPFLPLYHRTLSFLTALSYGFPARRLTVIGVTGTKGKSTVAEMLFSILSASGEKVALVSTIRFALGNISEPNRFKMTMPGRGFVQSFMHRALLAKCTYLVIEITSEAVLQYRHQFLALDGLVVTNVQHEHIEHHGSFENYVAAKRKIVCALEHSPKKKRILVANEDISESREFLTAHVSKAIGFGTQELKKLEISDEKVSFNYQHISISVPLPGKFNALNTLAAIKLCEAFGVSLATAADAVGSLSYIPGRVERINAGQDFIVIVDYAHTPDSLAALYGAFPNHRKICVLGNAGGGRDTWKRAAMGRIADEACDEIILTNEDPYDENPHTIVQAMAQGMARAPHIIMDRRKAIHRALVRAEKDTVVLISGKGTDPFIMGPRGTKIPWSDSSVTHEELVKVLSKKRAPTPVKI